jgi:hypothetical protein
MKTIACLAVLTLTSIAAAGCDDLGSPAVLDRPRVLAVRAEPPHLAAGGSARIDVLVGDAAGRAVVVAPDLVAPAVDVPGLVHHTADGWTITAPGEDVLAAMRTELELAPTDPIRLPLDVAVAVDGDELTALKVVVLGSAAANPVIGGMTLGGADVTGAVVVPVGDVALAPAAVTATGELAYAWYSSVGELAGYRSEQATLTAVEPGAGQIVLVVRDDQYGVGWATADLVVQ